MKRTSQDAERIDQAIAKLAVAWRVGVDEVVMAAYTDAFDGLTVEEIEATCKDAATWPTDHMPAAGSIRQQALIARRRSDPKAMAYAKDIAQRRREISKVEAQRNLQKLKDLVNGYGKEERR